MGTTASHADGDSPDSGADATTLSGGGGASSEDAAPADNTGRAIEAAAAGADNTPAQLPPGSELEADTSNPYVTSPLVPNGKDLRIAYLYCKHDDPSIKSGRKPSRISYQADIREIEEVHNILIREKKGRGVDVMPPRVLSGESFASAATTDEADIIVIATHGHGDRGILMWAPARSPGQRDSVLVTPATLKNETNVLLDAIRDRGHMPKLVILGVCEGLPSAQALVDAGVPAVIAFTGELYNATASVFVGTLLRLIVVHGWSVQEAFRLALAPLNLGERGGFDPQTKAVHKWLESDPRDWKGDGSGAPASDEDEADESDAEASADEDDAVPAGPASTENAMDVSRNFRLLISSKTRHVVARSTARSAPPPASVEKRVPFCLPAPQPASECVFTETRGNEVKIVWDHVLSGRGRGTRVVAVQGPGGTGKSSILRRIARDTRVGGTFTGGIIYACLGQHPDLLAWQGKVLRALHGAPTYLGSKEQGAEQIQAALSRMSVLLILDDVWAIEHVFAFTGDVDAASAADASTSGDGATAGGASESSCVLMATRPLSAVPVSASCVTIAGLDEASAIVVLNAARDRGAVARTRKQGLRGRGPAAAAAGSGADDSPDALEVVRHLQCRPLALNVIGTLAGLDGETWARVKKWTNTHATAIEGGLKYVSVAQCIRRSGEFLRDKDRWPDGELLWQAFLRLAAFQPEVVIPLKLLHRLWKTATNGWVHRLADSDLVSLAYDGPVLAGISLQRMQFEFIEAELQGPGGDAEAVEAAHRDVVAALAAPGGAGSPMPTHHEWWTMLDEAARGATWAQYGAEHLCWHLLRGGSEGRAELAWLCMQLRWLEGRRCFADDTVAAVLRDLEELSRIDTGAALVCAAVRGTQHLITDTTMAEPLWHVLSWYIHDPTASAHFIELIRATDVARRRGSGGGADAAAVFCSHAALPPARAAGREFTLVGNPMVHAVDACRLLSTAATEVSAAVTMSWPVGSKLNEQVTPTLELWNLDAGGRRVVSVPLAHKVWRRDDAHMCVVASAGEQVFTAVGINNIASVWTLDADARVATRVSEIVVDQDKPVSGHNVNSVCVASLPHAEDLRVVTGFYQKIRVWDVPRLGGEARCVVDIRPGALVRVLRPFTTSDSGAYVAACLTNGVAVWDVASPKKPLWHATTFTVDEDDGTVTQYPFKGDCQPWCIDVFQEAGDWRVASWHKDGYVVKWNALPHRVERDDAREPHALVRPLSQVTTGLACNPGRVDHRCVVEGSDGHAYAVHSDASHVQMFKLDGSGVGARTLIDSARSGIVAAWRIPRAPARTAAAGSGRPAVSCADRFVAVGLDGTASVWSPQDNDAHGVPDAPPPLSRSASLSTSSSLHGSTTSSGHGSASENIGRVLAFATPTKQARAVLGDGTVFDTAAGQSPQRLEHITSLEHVMCVVREGAGPWAVCAHERESNALSVRDLATGDVVANLRLHAAHHSDESEPKAAPASHEVASCACAFAQDGEAYVAVGTAARSGATSPRPATINVFKLGDVAAEKITTLRPIRVLKGHKGKVLQVTAHRSGEPARARLVSNSADGCVRLWDPLRDSDQLVATFSDVATVMSSRAQSGERVATLLLSFVGTDGQERALLRTHEATASTGEAKLQTLDLTAQHEDDLGMVAELPCGDDDFDASCAENPWEACTFVGVDSARRIAMCNRRRSILLWREQEDGYFVFERVAHVRVVASQVQYVGIAYGGQVQLPITGGGGGGGAASSDSPDVAASAGAGSEGTGAASSDGESESKGGGRPAGYRGDAASASVPAITSSGGDMVDTLLVTNSDGALMVFGVAFDGGTAHRRA